MVRCAECGQFNNDDVAVCTACGAEILPVDTKLTDEIIAKAEKQFETDYKMNLDESRVTYICSVCGEVNLLNNKVCQKCGKPRPRSEFIKTLTEIKQGKIEKANFAEKKNKEALDAQKEQETAAKVEEQKELFKNLEKLENPIKLYKFVPESVEKEDKIDEPKKFVQPLVIVPYVDQGHPLLQYNPYQLYRMDGNNVATESNVNVEVKLQMPEAPKSVEELKAIQYAKLQELKTLENQILSMQKVDAVMADGKKKKRRREKQK